LAPVDEFNHFIEGRSHRNTKHIRKHDIAAYGGLEFGSAEHFPQKVVWSNQPTWLSIIVKHDQNTAGDVNQTMSGFLKAVFETNRDVFIVKVKVAKNTDHKVTPEW
jgi:hypothetical protein